MKSFVCIILALAVAASAVEEPRRIEKRGIYGGLPLGTIGLGGIPLGYGLGAPIAAPIAPLGLHAPLIGAGLPLSTGLPLNYGYGLGLGSYGLGSYGLPLGLGGIPAIL